MHAQVHDVATGLTNDGAGLAQHARRILDRRPKAPMRNGVAFGLWRPLQVSPQVFLVLERGEARAVDGVDRQDLRLGIANADNPITRNRAAAGGEGQLRARMDTAAAHIEPRPLTAFNRTTGSRGLAFNILQAGEDRIEHLACGNSPATYRFKQIIWRRHREPIQRLA